MAISRDRLQFADGAKIKPISSISGSRKALLVHASKTSTSGSASNSMPQETTVARGRKSFSGSLAKKYELISEIGSGGMGVIYKAKQPLLDRYYAIKMLHLHKSDNLALARFQQEAKAVSNLNHPNVIGVHDFGFTDEDDPYMVMDFIDGVSLARLISYSGRLRHEEALNIFVQIANGMTHAHAQGVLHRDLKPSNIMLCNPESATPEVKIVDFGIAKIHNAEQSGGLTQTGDVFGSPLYMSPEQASSRKVDARSDIYSLGCLMYEVLTGRPPFQAETIIQTMFMHMNDDPPSLHANGCNSLPAGLNFIVRKCLAKNPCDRYQSMLELQKDLVRVATGQNIKEEKLLPKGTERPFYTSRMFSVFAVLCGCLAIICVMYEVIEMRFNSKEIEARKFSQGLSTRLQEINENTLLSLNPEAFARQERNERKTAIDLKGCFANDAVMSELDGDRELVSLGLRDSNLTAAGFKHMNLPNLQKLDLQESDVCEQLFESLGKLTELRSLSLAKTALSDKDVSQLLKLKHLESLDLRNTHITDGACKLLAKMPALTNLNLSFDNISDKGVADLASLGNLETLDLYCDKITDVGVAKICAMSSLRILILSGTAITDHGVQLVSKMPLERLFLAGSGITERSAAYLVKMNSLQFLDLRETRQLRQEVREHIQDRLERAIVRFEPVYGEEVEPYPAPTKK